MDKTRKPTRLLLGTGVATAAVLALTGAVLPAAAHASDTPTGVIANAGAENVVPGSYLVTLNSAEITTNVERTADSLAETHGLEVTQVYQHALEGFAFEATEAEALELAADPAVAEVTQDQVVHASATQSNPPSWGLDRIDQASLPLDNSYTYPDHAGEGVTVYVVDTGVRYSHQDFGGRASFGFDAYGGDGSDGQGHGTHVAGTAAGTAYGVAKEADIVSVRVLDNNGSGTIAAVVAGVDWVTGDADGPSVANMSLGGAANSTLDAAVENSVASGVTYAVAAGNEYGTDASTRSPARVQTAITVGSTTSTDAISPFSNVGSVVDLFAPGSSITSAWHTSDTAENTISGTSMAAPHVAGGAALFLAENPDATPAEVEAALTGSAVADAITGIPGSTANLLLNVSGDGTGPGNPPAGERFESTSPVAIVDNSTISSDIEVSDVGELSGAFEVEVDITHTWVGDLTVSLTSPEGASYLLRERSGGSADDIQATYRVAGAGVDADGTWTLEVTDSATLDQGTLNAWALQF
ncbi:S8 family peptidase [Streptomyces profundus]|uniref:S8 family peptidase n=1 Tax=Streptomyces profundus TaxID=2867410 RepID=UPI001D16EDBA|nr:S8 family serine peptidase [Streptomyces sp. MA3_2.13]UED83356.1 S8 family peptidase [Streptomyces sp. MA3_2.13]